MIGFRRRTPKLEAGHYARQTAEELLSTHRETIQRIRRTVALDERYWKALYQSVLDKTAEFCQQLPASEFHHHSGPGGLLTHTLDVIERALLTRRGYILPTNASAEDAAAEQDLWTYCVFTAAILHDIGKPLADQLVDLYDPTGKNLGLWNPWLGAIPTTATTYRIRYYRGENGKRDYHLHEKSALLLAGRMIPDIGLKWISDNRRAFPEWLNAVSGDIENAGALGEIIKAADMASVASNTAGSYTAAISGEQVTAAVTRNKPMAERLLIALRQLLKGQELPLNRNGAAGWVAGDSLWMVSQRTLDKIREWMISEGQTGIPNHNTRLMDELLSTGLVIANGDRAIWTCRIQGRDWAKENRLTMLRFSLERIWPDPAARPPQFDCILLNAETNADLLGEAAPAPDPSVGGTNKIEPPVAGEQAERAFNSVGATNKQDLGPGITEQKPVNQDVIYVTDRENREQYSGIANHVQETPISTGFEGLDLTMPPLATPEIDEASNQEITREESPADSSESKGERPLETALVGATNKDDSEGAQGEGGEFVGDTNKTETEEVQDKGMAFLQWLRASLKDRKLEINTQNSMIHIVEEGMLLLSPAIFKRYAHEDWANVQSRFCKKVRIHRRTAGGENIHTYVVVGKKTKGKRIKGLLIQDIAAVFPGINLPKPNTFLIQEEFYLAAKKSPQ